MMPFPLKSLFSPYYALRTAEAALVVALALALAEFAWLLFPGPGQGDSRAPVAALSPAQAGLGAPARGGLGRRLSPALLSLFGEAGNNPGKAAFREEEIRETGLDLTLKGILASRSGTRKLAVISRGGEKEDVYRIGNQIAGAEITHIKARRVILERNGVAEALTLKTAEPRYGSSFAGLRATEGITMVSARAGVVSRNLFDRQLQRLPEVLNQARAAPYWDNNGHDAGFRIVDIEPDSVFDKLGLLREDVIVSLNGVSVRNNREALAAYQSFKSADALQVGLLRDGREVTIDFSIQ